MRVMWALAPKSSRKEKPWHAFVYFTKHHTRGSVCSAFLTPPSIEEQHDKVPAHEPICGACSLGVLGMRKRYVLEGSATPA